MALTERFLVDSVQGIGPVSDYGGKHGADSSLPVVTTRLPGYHQTYLCYTLKGSSTQIQILKRDRPDTIHKDSGIGPQGRRKRPQGR